MRPPQNTIFIELLYTIYIVIASVIKYNLHHDFIITKKQAVRPAFPIFGFVFNGCVKYWKYHQ